jgi:hypothetical protein
MGGGEMLAADGRPNVIAGDQYEARRLSARCQEARPTTCAAVRPRGPTCAQSQRPMASFREISRWVTFGALTTTNATGPSAFFSDARKLWWVPIQSRLTASDLIRL